MFIHPVLKEMGHTEIEQNTTIFEDNQPAIHIIQQSNCNSKRSKHYDVKVKYVIDILAKRNAQICKVRSENQLADFMTKNLGTPQFRKARDAIMVNVSNGVAGIKLREDLMAQLVRAFHN
jgi:hypothetical protein